MKIIGLSGGIASGKNFIAELFAKKGAAIFDADKEVHELFINDQDAINQVAQHFPSVLENNKINRKILSKLVFQEAEKLQILEKILHKKVRQKYQEFLEANQSKIKVLNVPLLLESQAYKCDKIIMLDISEETQKQRFLQREKELNQDFSYEKAEQKFFHIKSKQMPNEKRRQFADFIIDMNLPKTEIEKQVDEIWQAIR